MRAIHDLIEANFYAIVAGVAAVSATVLTDLLGSKIAGKIILPLGLILLLIAMYFKFAYHPAFYYDDALEWAIQNRITNETADTFRPNDICNLRALMTFLYRYKREPPVSGTAQEGIDYSTLPMLWASGAGLIPRERLVGTDPVTREDAIRSLYRLWQIDGGNDYATLAAWAREQKITDTDPFEGERACTRGNAITFLYRYSVAIEGR